MHRSPDSEGPSRNCSLAHVFGRRPRGRALLPAAVTTAALLSFSCEPGGGDAVQLRLEPEPGDSQTYEVVQETRVELPEEMEGGGEREMRLTLLLRQAAGESRGDTLHYAFRIEDIEMEVPDPGAEESGQEQREEALEAVRGEEFEVSVTRRGEILDTSFGPELAMASAPLTDIIRLSGFLPHLPSEPVRDGESWSHDTELEPGALGIPMLTEEIEASAISTLRDLSQENGTTVAELEVETTYRHEPEETSPVLYTVDLDGTSTGTVRFDVTNGRLIGSSGSRDFTVDASVPGQGSVVVEGSATHRVSVADTGP